MKTVEEFWKTQVPSTGASRKEVLARHLRAFARYEVEEEFSRAEAFSELDPQLGRLLKAYGEAIVAVANYAKQRLEPNKT